MAYVLIPLYRIFICFWLIVLYLLLWLCSLIIFLWRFDKSWITDMRESPFYSKTTAFLADKKKLVQNYRTPWHYIIRKSYETTEPRTIEYYWF